MQLTHRSASGTAFVLAASVLWGTTGTAAAFIPQVSPLAIGAAAMGIGGMLQALVAARTLLRQRGRLAQHRLWLLAGAVAVAVYPLAFYTSMRWAGVAVGTVVSIGSAPVLAALIERIVDGERLGPRWAIGAALGITGAVLLCLAQANPGEQAPAPLPGILLGVVAGATYALYSFAARRLMHGGVPRNAAMGATFGLGGILLVPVLLATGASLLTSPQTIAVSAYMALVPMFAGYLLFGAGLWRIRSSTATTLSLAEPLVAAVLAVLIVHERLPVLGWIGVALIGCCLLVVVVTRTPSRHVNSIAVRAGKREHAALAQSVERFTRNE